MRFVGLKNNNVCIVSDNPIVNSELEIFPVPKELDDVESSKLFFYKIKNGIFHNKSEKIPRNKLKIAFVGNWKMKCGIATYSESLWGHIVKEIADFRLLIEEQNNYIGQLNKTDSFIFDENKIIPCWKRGESLKSLIEEIKKFDPDIVFIQHEYGLWSNARYWMALLTQLSNYRVVVTMHSVFPNHKDKTIIEAAIPEIVVHLEQAKKCLEFDKNIPGKVYLIPHGCNLPIPGKLWNFYKSEHTFMQMGFLFRYKSWSTPIKIVALLKDKYPDIFFTGLLSESEFSTIENQLYYDELIDLIDKLEVKENVALIRGFQSDETLNSYLRTNKVAIFPYTSNPEHEVFGASGAARLAMSKGLPVITSFLAHFSDLPSIKADSVEEMAKELEKLFLDRKVVEAQISKQNEFLNENSWGKVAEKYLFLFEN